MPKVSVVMPVHNTKIDYLRESINSILNQSYSDFEFIIIDDCSNKETKSFLKSFDDSRIILKHNAVNLGITKSLNIGFESAIGKYIARMDSDDIAKDDRIEKQVNYMEANPDVIVCGSGIRLFSDSDELKNTGRYYIPQIIDMETFRIQLLFDNYGPPHPTALFNRCLLNKYSLRYDEYYENSQDYAMWVTCASIGRIHILNDILLNYRIHNAQISINVHQKQQFFARVVKKKQLCSLLGSVSDEMVVLHEQAYNSEITPNKAIWWFKKLKSANKKKKIYDVKAFSTFIKRLIDNQKMLNYENSVLSVKHPIIGFILYPPHKYKIDVICNRIKNF